MEYLWILECRSNISSSKHFVSCMKRGRFLKGDLLDTEISTEKLNSRGIITFLTIKYHYAPLDSLPIFTIGTYRRLQQSYCECFLIHRRNFDRKSCFDFNEPEPLFNSKAIIKQSVKANQNTVSSLWLGRVIKCLIVLTWKFHSTR